MNEWCPINCAWHASATHWVEEGDLVSLRAHLDSFAVMKDTSWKRCRCNLWLRIQEALAKDRDGHL